MFTSKKAQYLNKDFDNISPITNIDTLYYEQVYKNGDNYDIVRRSVAKNMPIQFKVPDDTYIMDTSNNISSSSFIPDNVNVNINYTKHVLNPVLNPLDNNKPVYDKDMYTVDSSKYVNISQLIKYYTPISQFCSSTQVIENELNIIDTSLQYTSDYVDDTTLVANDLENAIYFDTRCYHYDDLISKYDHNELVNNGIYNLIYYPGQGFSDLFEMIIKVMCVSTNEIKDLVSLDIAYPYGMGIHIPVNSWDFHYDISTNRITYLKDEFGNEGNFDFRNQYINSLDERIYNNDYTQQTFSNNKIYLNDIQNSSIKFSTEYSHTGNQIYYSKNIFINSNSSNNIIKNSNGISFGWISNNNNIIINSSSQISDRAISLKDSNNNILINNLDSSIVINGDFNTVVNTQTLNVSLKNNNYIINDNVHVDSDLELNKNSLFLSGSTKTAIDNGIGENAIIFGGSGHDVSVYMHSSNTL